MFNLEDFFQGWTGYLTGNPEAAKRAAPRLVVCANCEKLVKGSIFAAKCGKCGCPVEAKARARRNGCPLNKWEN